MLYLISFRKFGKFTLDNFTLLLFPFIIIFVSSSSSSSSTSSTVKFKFRTRRAAKFSPFYLMIQRKPNRGGLFRLQKESLSRDLSNNNRNNGYRERFR